MGEIADDMIDGVYERGRVFGELNVIKTKRKSLVTIIKRFGPCEDAVAWLNTQKTVSGAWKACRRGDWMLWLIGKLGGEPESEARKKLVFCACECARLALPFFEKQYPSDCRVRTCIETVERWAKDKATRKELHVARKAVADVAYAYTAYAAANVAYAYAYTAYAAANVAYAYTAYAAANVAASAAARAKALAKCADIVRKHYPKPPKITEAT